MDFEHIQNLDEAYLCETYRRYPVSFEGGEGATLFGTDGKHYLDFGSGIAVNIFGADDKEWKNAVKAQIDKISHVSNYYYSEPQGKLAQLLCEKTGARRVFFSNSGAEANECAMKAARKYSFDHYGEGRYKIVTLKNSFHGRTLFTLSATGQDIFHRYFMPFVEGVENVEFGYNALEKALDQTCCALMVECVQGESGVNPLDKELLQKITALCKERDILLICDEVQCGNGRTGKLYAYENYDIEPDIVTTAKGLGGGLPIGVCMFFHKTEHTLSAGDHGSTFGGNPVSCAGAYNVLSRLTNEFLLEIKGKGEYLATKLKAIDGVENVTGMGLMIGVKTQIPATDVAKKALERGLLVLTAHDKVRLLPPLNITKNEMDEGLAIIREVLKK